MNVDPPLVDEQSIVTKCYSISASKDFYVATVYAQNRNLKDGAYGTSSWLLLLLCRVLGCLQVILTVFDSSMKKWGPVPSGKLASFNKIIKYCGLADIKSVGSSWTWSNNQDTNWIVRKLDRVLVNSDWCDSFLDSFSLYKQFQLTMFRFSSLTRKRVIGEGRVSNSSVTCNAADV